MKSKEFGGAIRVDVCILLAFQHHNPMIAISSLNGDDDVIRLCRMISPDPHPGERGGHGGFQEGCPFCGG
jgi:hypothetical protein